MPSPEPATPVATQKIFRFRREYNSWVADETMEDYALRYTPRSFRKWSEWRVANTAFGSLSFLALEAIGGAIAVNYGFANAMWAILVVGLVIFFTSLPIAYYAARYGLDMDLLTRGAGFGYLGSTITSLIYAVFTFIFFAIEAVIMALALEMATGWPLAWCYLISAVVIVPLVIRGITLISKLQAWTQPLYLFLLVLPFVWIGLSQPQLYRDFTTLTGIRSGSNEFHPLMFGAAAAVIFSLVVQIGEQVDFLRFMPERTRQNRVRWWMAVLIPGPGWIVMGMLKMVGGAFLAFAAMQFEVDPERTAEPTQMFLAGFTEAVGHPGLAVAMTVVFVILAQVKINVTNAYAGSLAWSNFFARVTHSHPGRVVWLVFNVCIATLLMLLGVFTGLEKVLGVYSNVAIAWVGALVADLIINKPLGLSPKGIEFRRAHLYDFNPVGMGSMIIAALVASLAYTGVMGEYAAAFSPFIALGLALLLAPLIAWATKGRYYLARKPSTEWKRGEAVRCSVCENQFESDDMASCPAYQAPICSLCCSLESRCHDRCKTNSRAIDQVRAALTAILPKGMTVRVNFRAGQFLAVWLSLSAIMAFLIGMVYVQESLHAPAEALQLPFLKIYAFLVLLAAVCAWWVVLTTDSRRMAQDESERQTQLLMLEIDAHQRTDAELQSARDRAEAASQAKTRYVAGMTHELRTPLTSILGYAQILLKNSDISVWVRETIATMQRSGQHMHALIDGSLDLARIEAGRLKLDPVPLPLAQLLEDVERMVRPQAEAKGLRFVVQQKGELPPWVRADAKRLRQILINLLSNAVRFTDKGEVTLRLDFRQQVARIDVIDTGIGIAAQDQKRIFLPFERGSAGRRAADTGTGLGLTITHLLTDMMGGELLLKSRPGHGSTFSLRLYLPPIPSDPKHPLPIPSTMRAVTGYLGERRTLLVVDDQPLHRQLLASILVPLGFVVREAASGQECLEIIEQHPPDLLLLDLTMDGLDGWQTAEAVRALLPAARLPIVFVSANLFDNRPERLTALDCQGFVAKPMMESELLDALKHALALEWVTEQAPATAPVSFERHRVTGLPLPEDLREELQRLARQGQAAALRQRLWQAQTAEPAHAATLALLQSCADRFDFQTLIEYLRDTAELTEEDDIDN
ncbi:hybrid sensor histidine kinase/response regulator [Hydrogenophaga laconesensis]|uniref:histidine kinase n=1 Tax=Hydrogenophaga laconesensis TaxID=1805971 RepID=A0ABU1VG82_9BURK|nr:ATP-binding protein [Hydrogenophaga laconesensis]MDR7096350.1 signal transduction histidine kinase/DNA-binding NarL/FixJ family response regulator [Hydrogenophaga laconesensis]